MTMVSRDFYILRRDAFQQLQACLEEISNPSPDSMSERFGLNIYCEYLTSSILALLVQVLNRPLSKTGAGTDTKWDNVHFDSPCRFVRASATPLAADNEGFCCENDIQIFASSLASRTLSLSVDTRHYQCEILECLYNIPYLAFKKLKIDGLVLGTSEECARFADLVQRCTLLIDLQIGSFYFEEPLYIAKVLLDNFHLERICFLSWIEYSSPRSIVHPLFCWDGGNGSLCQLLNPQYRLRNLCLNGMKLKDCHFLSIVEMLPTSLLEVLDVSFNNIGREGILAFASQLPRIKLKQVILEDYRHRRSHVYTACIAELVDGMIENNSLECLTVDREVEELEYCTNTNRQRRLILSAADSIPVGLWPFILENVGRRKWNPRWEQQLIWRNYRTNALHLVLQNCALPFLGTPKSIP